MVGCGVDWCSSSLRRLLCLQMGRFKKVTSGAAGGASAGPATPAPAVTDLAVLMSMSPLPLGGVTTVGRISYVFGWTHGYLDLSSGEFSSVGVRQWCTLRWSNKALGWGGCGPFSGTADC